MQHVKLKARKAGSVRTNTKKGNLHGLAYSGIAREDDTSIASDLVEQFSVKMTNEQDIRAKFVAEEALSIAGTQDFQHRVIGYAHPFHRTKRLANFGELWLLNQLVLLKKCWVDDRKTVNKGLSEGRLTAMRRAESFNG